MASTVGSRWIWGSIVAAVLGSVLLAGCGGSGDSPSSSTMDGGAPVDATATDTEKPADGGNPDCSRCEADTNSCFPNPCQNGSCQPSTGSGYTCQCSVGYTGAYCDKPVDCGTPPTVANAGAPTVSGANGGATTGYRATASYPCNVGYAKMGTDPTCQANGSWSTAPTCQALTCPTLSNPANGTVTTTGPTATYVCASGFILNRKRDAHVPGQRSVEWNGPVVRPGPLPARSVQRRRDVPGGHRPVHVQRGLYGRPLPDHRHELQRKSLRAWHMREYRRGWGLHMRVHSGLHGRELRCAGRLWGGADGYERGRGRGERRRRRQFDDHVRGNRRLYVQRRLLEERIRTRPAKPTGCGPRRQRARSSTAGRRRRSPTPSPPR